MKRKWKTVAVVTLVAAGLVVWGILMCDKHMVYTVSSSNLLSCDDELLLVISCVEGHVTVTTVSQIKALMQWRQHAATDAIPIRTDRYSVIYHVKAGQLHRWRIDDPVYAELITPWNGGFYVRGTDANKQKRLWKWKDNSFRSLSDDETSQIEKEMPVGYSDAVKRQGWANDMKFNPGSFKEAEKRALVKLKECNVELKISKSKSSVVFWISVDGPHASSHSDEFIHELRAAKSSPAPP